MHNDNGKYQCHTAASCTYQRHDAPDDPRSRLQTGEKEVDEDDDLQREARAAITSSCSSSSSRSGVDDAEAAPGLQTPETVRTLDAARRVQGGEGRAHPLALRIRSLFRFRFGGWACARMRKQVHQRVM